MDFEGKQLHGLDLFVLLSIDLRNNNGSHSLYIVLTWAALFSHTFHPEQ